MTTAIWGIPLYSWIIGGVALASFLFNSGYSVNTPKMDQFSDPGVGVGPWTSPTTSQTAVPLLFGTSRYPVPLLHYRLDGDQFRNQWLIFGVGEDWRTLSAGEYENKILNIWINDYEIEEMAEYTEDPDLFDADHSWFKFFPSGVGMGIDWNVSGKHVFTKKAEIDGPAESYALICTHADTEGDGPVHVTVRTIHEWPENGAWNRWRVKVKYLEEVPGQDEFITDWEDEFFDATQTVEAGKDSETYHIAGTEERVYEWDMPDRGKFNVTVEVEDHYDSTTLVPPVAPDPANYSTVVNENGVEHPGPDYAMALWAYKKALKEYEAELENPKNKGKVYLDSVVIDDPGGAYETHNFNGTSCVLIRLIDNTGELSRPTVNVLAEGGPSNPAEVLEWVLTNTEIGMAVPEEHIDRGALAEVAEAMDAYGYTYDRAICQRSTFENVIQDVCGCGRIILAEWNGMYTPFLDEEIPESDIQEVDLDSQAVKNTLSYAQTALSKLPNAFTIKYVDKDVDYTLQDLVTENADLQAMVRSVNKREIPLLGVTSQAKAWEIGWYQIQYAMSDMILSFEAMPSLWGKIYPGWVFRARSGNDPLVDVTDWMVVGVEESEPGKYRVQASQYRREAYHAPEITEWVPDVWIPGGSLGVSDGPQESPYGMVVSHFVGEDPSPSHVRITFTLSNVPSNARRVRCYRSYTGYLDGTTSVSGYEAVGDIITPNNVLTLVERIKYTAVYFRFPVVDENGEESSLDSAPIVTVYPFLSLDDLPGFGNGDFGISFYGG